jgi:uncharacterized membrane protein YfhO
MQSSTFDYPGWTALVDNTEVPISPASVSGEITFNVPAGTHNVQLELRPTPIRRWSFYLSVVTLALITILIGWSFAAPKPTYEVETKVPSKSRPKKAGRR